ncbi:MAG: DNA internalization-related competence protein ComEC/Rec2 [Lachnospiraceae bacterium]|nr:DNA internalization-related competence protein ComEC/Rec2 [Lachnospiraceae bacterium]
MIKRPLLVLAGIFVCGIVCSRWGENAILLITAALSVLMIAFPAWLCRGKRFSYFSKWSSTDFILYLGPLLFLIGAILTIHAQSQTTSNDLTETKLSVIVSGTVIKLSEEGAKETTGRMVLSNVRIEGSEERLDSLLIYRSDQEDIKIGNRVSAVVTLLPLTHATNEGQFNEFSYYQAKKIYGKAYGKKVEILSDNVFLIRQAAYSLKRKMAIQLQKLLPKKEAGIMAAMLTGDKSLLSDEVKEIYQEGGISHILAISGLHVSLLGMSLFSLLKRIRVPIYLSILLSILFLIFYGIMTEFTVSALRAILMLSLRLVAILAGRTYDRPTAIGLSALIILVHSPLELFQSGFLLSFGAIIAISALHPVLIQFFLPTFIEPEDNGVIERQSRFLRFFRGIAESFMASVAIQIVSIPIILAFFYEIPLYSVILNVFVLPLVTVVAAFGLVAVLASFVILPVGTFLIGIVYYILQFYEKLCRISFRLPYYLILNGKPDSGALIFYYIVGILLLLGIYRHGMKKRKQIWRIFSVISYLFMLLCLHPSSDTLAVTCLDIGQGDSIVIGSAQSTVITIDGGSSTVSKAGEYRLMPYLRSQGFYRVKYAFITHADSDHYNAVLEILQQMKDGGEKSGYHGRIVIENLVFPKLSDYDDAYQALWTLAEEKGVKVHFFTTGSSLICGDMVLTCLYPTEGERMEKGNTNQNSLVLYLSYHEFDALFTGDLETEKESCITKYFTLNPKSLELLKVGHHGSKNASGEEMVSLLKPRVSFISCAKNNSYGHPHKEVLERLQKVGSEIVQTSIAGRITIQTDGYQMKITEWNK